MLSTAQGAPRGVAAYRACVPCSYTADGRRSVAFLEPLEELVDAVGLTRPGFGAMASEARTARALCCHVLRVGVQPSDVPQLLVCVPADRCAAAGATGEISTNRFGVVPPILHGCIQSGIPKLSVAGRCGDRHDTGLGAGGTNALKTAGVFVDASPGRKRGTAFTSLGHRHSEGCKRSGEGGVSRCSPRACGRGGDSVALSCQLNN